MPKIKVPRSSPSLDMTPMVDLAFLLVTFFMLTASFRASEPLIVDTPSSTKEDILPQNVMMITIDSTGRVYYNISGKDIRRRMVQMTMKQYPELKLNSQEIQMFSLMNDFGMPAKDLRKYILASEDERKQMDKATKGIPYQDSLNNQLKDWIYNGYVAYKWHMDSIKQSTEGDKAIRFAIKADGNTDFSKVQKVIDVFRDKNIFRFNLVTDLESAPEPKTNPE